MREPENKKEYASRNPYTSHKRLSVLKKQIEEFI